MISASQYEEWDAWAARLIYIVRAHDLGQIKSLHALEIALRNDRHNECFADSDEERWYLVRRVREAKRLST